MIRPRVYLEIGVHYGHSLALAVHSDTAIGIDPNPLIAPSGNQVIHAITSDQFFTVRVDSWRRHIADGSPYIPGWIDMAFIDGMHLFEYALRDFRNVEHYSKPGSIIVFDDVLPRNQAEASRTQPPGDWTGDVWRIIDHLLEFRPDLRLTLVDTDPTGLLVVQQLDPVDGYERTPVVLRAMEFPVPDEIINRDGSFDPESALKIILEVWERSQ